MVESIVHRLLPLLNGDDFTLKFGFVLAFLLGLWLGWGWKRKNVVISCVTCAADWSGDWQGDFRAPGEEKNNGGRV